jgi:uncharacterized protein YceH (UPF0502 family)
MLRGAQTPGELKGRTERLHPFADLGAIHATLERLIGRELVEQLPRRPGQKEERYAHRLSDDEAPQPSYAAPPIPAAVGSTGYPASAPAASAVPARVLRTAPGRPMPVAPEAAPRAELPLADRVARLEDEVAQLRAELRALRGR